MKHIFSIDIMFSYLGGLALIILGVFHIKRNYKISEGSQAQFREVKRWITGLMFAALGLLIIYAKTMNYI